MVGLEARPASAGTAAPVPSRSPVRWATILFVAALIFGAGLRFFNLNWDDGAHLHPDERAIVMVATGLHWPQAGADAAAIARGGHGPLDPHFFAYGSLPIYLLAAAGNVAHRLGVFLVLHGVSAGGLARQMATGDQYEGMNLVGRFLSALFDTGSIVLCFLIGRRLYDARAGAIAAAGYAVTALAVQQAHFYVVDPVLTLFTMATLFFALRSTQDGRQGDALAAGVCLGWALATKVSAIPLGLAVLLAQVLPMAQARHALDLSARRELIAGRTRGLIFSACGAAVAFLVTEPYAILDWPQFLHDVGEQSAMVRGVADLPYTRQYAPTVPYLYWLQGLLTWQMTPPLALFGLTGLGFQAWNAGRRWNAESLLVAWWLPYLTITGAFYAKFPRYMLPAAPLLCIAMGGLFARLRRAPRRRVRRLALALVTVTLAIGALYCLAYEHIYATTNTRVAASDWIYQHIPAQTGGHQTVLTHELWDDSLPLERAQHQPGWTPGRYVYVDVPIYDDDTAQKQEALIQDLQHADYVIEASDIVRGSILRNPQRYPLTTAYYRALADGTLGFQEVARFRNGPQLFGLRIDDSSADLNWQFYDHPPVTIYRKVRDVPATAMARLLAAPSPGSAAAARGTAALTLSPAAAAADSTAPTLDQMFPPNGLGMRFPIPVWFVTVEVLGVLAFPWSARLLGSLPDGGFGGAKVLGILLVGWVAWLLASTGIAWNTRTTILFVVGLFSVLSAVGWLTLPAAGDRWRRHWRVWVFGEAVFVVTFAVFVAIRAANPDLWQLYRGGEKPMELSYVYAILRSRLMPPYDPWFAGSTVNYYYVGLYLMAMLFKLTRTAPTVGFNLAIPLLYGLSMQLAATVAYALTALLIRGGTMAPGPRTLALALDRRAVAAGLLAACLFGGVGNLDSGPYLIGLLRQSGATVLSSAPPIIGPAAQMIAGLVRTLATGGAALPAFNYFDRTRVIPYTINEFPFFSFLYADLHPHVIAMPFELLAIALAVALIAGRKELAAVPIGPSAVFLAGLLLGALWPINVWDFPTYLLLVVLAMGLRHFRGSNALASLRPALLYGAAITVIGRVAFLPFFQHFAPASTGIGVPPQHSDLGHFLLIYGLFFFLAGTAIVLDQGLAPPGIALLLAPAFAIGIASQSAVLALLCGMLILLLRAAWLRRYHSPLQAVYLLLGLALAVILGTELIFIKDPLQGSDWERMNTVFKFGIQAWILLSVSGGPLVVWLTTRPPSPFWSPARPGAVNTVALASEAEAFPLKHETSLAASPRAGPVRPVPPGSLASPGAFPGARAGRPRRGRLLPVWWRTALAVGLLTAAIYPVLATPARVTDRWPQNAPTPSLDGMAFMKTSYPADYAAITWLQGHIAGAPVILEANKGDYAWYGRVSWFTGLPTVLGWSYHTSQFQDPARVAQREQVISALYTTPDPVTALRLLDRYHVALIYVGPLERETYAPATGPGAGGAGLAKFEAMVGTSLDRIYDRAGVTIYRRRTAG